MRALCVVIVLVMCGCASDDYAKYVASQEAMQIARSNAEIAKFKAMSDIASKGDTTVQVAAMMAMLGLTSNTSTNTINMAPPKSGWDTAREWMSIILPVAVQGYAISANARISTNASNNSRDVAVSTNNAFVGMAGKIQSTGPVNSYNTTPTTTTTSTSTSTTTADSNNTTTPTTSTDSHNSSVATTTTTDSHNTATDSHNITDSYNPVDNNSNQGNPINNTNNSNQGNPITNLPATP